MRTRQAHSQYTMARGVGGVLGLVRDGWRAYTFARLPFAASMLVGRPRMHGRRDGGHRHTDAMVCPSGKLSIACMGGKRSWNDHTSRRASISHHLRGEQRGDCRGSMGGACRRAQPPQVQLAADSSARLA